MADEKEPKDKQDVEASEESSAEETPKHHDTRPEKKESTKGDSRWHKFLAWYKSEKKKSIPLTAVLVLLLLAAWPFSRYHAAGLVLKRDFTLQVNDSKTRTPVSGASVMLGAASVQTNADGRATLHHVPVGQYTAVITKKYYDDRRVSVVVPIMAQKNTPQIAFTARGRQVKIVLANAINGEKLKGAEIKVSGTTATTDDNGVATIVVPAGVSSVKATLSAKDFNESEVTIQVSDKEVKENSFKLTPSGKVYFLSKLSGKIDVVKTSLDGTGRQTVLSGTGFEEDRGTVLLASRDWKFLALLSKRDKGNPKLYLINTGDDSLAVMDTANATFNPVGWSDDNFIYTTSNSGVQLWQPRQQSLKSYNASSKQITILDQTKAEGTNDYDFQHETYGTVYQIGKNVIYDKSWDWSWGTNATTLAQKANTIYSISATGSSPQTLKSFPLSGGNTYISSVPYEGGEIYYRTYPANSSTPSFYIYDNGKVTTSQKDLSNEFNEYQQTPSTYLLSPSGSSTFWSDERDGKKLLFVGDADGENGKQIAPLSEYQTYGWFTDDYLLVSKNSSELYILPKAGLKKDTDAIKISDYHKPARNFNGYGGGYGGI